MTRRVGSSFNTAIEAEGFLACCFCCSKDEGASCPQQGRTLAGVLPHQDANGCSFSQDAKWGSAPPLPQCSHPFPFACLQDLSGGPLTLSFCLKVLCSELELLGEILGNWNTETMLKAPWDPRARILALCIPQSLKIIWVLLIMYIRLTFKPFPRFPLQCDLLSSQHTGSKVCWRLNRMIRSSKKITLEWESALFG